MPAQTLEIPKRLPLVVSPENRDYSTAKDSRLVNGFIEKSETTGEYHLYKRQGLAVDTTLSGAGQGVYNWKGDIYAVFGTSLYKNGVSIGTVDATGGVYAFDQTLGATPYLVLGNGVKAYTWDNTTLAQITDVDFPAAFVKGWAYLDGTSYVMTAKAEIQGSDLNNPTSWDPLNVLIAQIEPDGGVALGKQLVYVIAFKQWSTEIFYDAANATGSPLGTVQGAKVNWGCANAASIQNVDGILFWIATNRNASVQVLALDNLKPQVISTPPIERLLDEADTSAGNVFSWSFKDEGHWFYGITLKSENLTLVYDYKERMWAQWTDKNGNYFPFVSATFDSDGNHIFQHETNGKLYKLDSTFWTDAGDLITVDIYTPNFDAGVRRRKQMNFLEFIGDQTPGSILQVRKSDDDYQTWSNFRTVDLSKRRPYLTGCGTFYRRAHHFRHACNTPLRLQAIEMQLDIGVL